MHSGDNGRIELLPSERHHHTTSLLHTLLQLGGERVGVLRGNGQGHYDIHVFFHVGKGTKKMIQAQQSPLKRGQRGV